MSYQVKENVLVKNQIEITFIENPHKFWFKYIDEVQQRLLKQLEDSLEKYITDLFEWGEQLLPISYGDVIVTKQVDGKKWIRGKAGKIQKGNKTYIKIWAIDHGCEMLLPLENVFMLHDQELACRHPINVHIGGLSGISPAHAVSHLYLYIPVFNI